MDSNKTNKRKQPSLLNYFPCEKDFQSSSTDVAGTECEISTDYAKVTDKSYILDIISPSFNTQQLKIIHDDQSKKDNLNLNDDIRNLIGKTLDDYTKFNLLKNSWKPPDNFKYLFLVHNKLGKIEKRFLRRNHFEQYPWLIYSISKSGCYCKYCTLFLTNNKGGKQKTEPLKKLVTLHLNQYSKLLGKTRDLEMHSNNKYHQEAILKSDDFLKTYNSPNKQIINIIKSKRLELVHENINRLKPIIDTIIFLGRQNIPFRGHRDSGPLLCKEPDSYKGPTCSAVKNDGNFRELLKYGVLSGDKNLENHLLNIHSKATYISSMIQEELIKCCKEEIIEHILNEIKENIYYSIIFYETSDITHTSQLSLFLRYIDSKKKYSGTFCIAYFIKIKSSPMKW